MGGSTSTTCHRGRRFTHASVWNAENYHQQMPRNKPYGWVEELIKSWDPFIHSQNKLFLAGNYSCLVAEFHLHRSIGFHLIQSYLPSILIVAISWVSFWMDVDCVPARVTLGVITLLTVSSQVSGRFSFQPKIWKCTGKKSSFLSGNFLSPFQCWKNIYWKLLFKLYRHISSSNFLC